LTKTDGLAKIFPGAFPISVMKGHTAMQTRPARILVLVVCLFFIIAACNLPGQASESTEEVPHDLPEETPALQKYSLKRVPMCNLMPRKAALTRPVATLHMLMEWISTAPLQAMRPCLWLRQVHP